MSATNKDINKILRKMELLEDILKIYTKSYLQYSNIMEKLVMSLNSLLALFSEKGKEIIKIEEEMKKNGILEYTYIS